jgi:hypothetical protein
MGSTEGRWASESETLIAGHLSDVIILHNNDLPATNRIRKAPKISPDAAESRRDLISNVLYHDLRIERIHLAMITSMIAEV